MAFPRRPLHDVRLGLLVGQGDGGQHVRAQIDAENGHGAQRQGDLEDHVEEKWCQFGDLRRKGVTDGLLQIVEDESSLFDAREDRGEVVVQENDVRRLFAHVGARQAHGDADVRLFQGGRIVHSVAGHGHDFSQPLATLDDDQLLLGTRSSEDDLRVVGDDLVQLAVGKGLQHVAVEDARVEGTVEEGGGTFDRRNGSR